MPRLSEEELRSYEHSPVHNAIAHGNHALLEQILSNLPRLPAAGEVRTEEESIAAESKADIVSAIIDRRDVVGRETPLHLAIRLKDAASVRLLMAAGAEINLQNGQGWGALQEAICAREDAIAMAIMRSYQTISWAKWCRRLPRIIAALRRMQNFYMELTYHFESSVIPFIGRIAPSDTYKIWKRGANLRADMTLSGFDGFKIQRSDQSFLFLGDGSEDFKVAPGTLCMLNHKKKEITDALEGSGNVPSDAELLHQIASLSKSNMHRPGIDVTEAELIPQVTWRKQERAETVGHWKAKVYDMHHVTISMRSRKVPGASAREAVNEEEEDQDAYYEFLTDSEKKQLRSALDLEESDDVKPLHVSRSKSKGKKQGSFGVKVDDSFIELSDFDQDYSSKSTKKGWFGWGKATQKQTSLGKKPDTYRKSLNLEEKVSGRISVAYADAKQAKTCRMSLDSRLHLKAEGGFEMRHPVDRTSSRIASTHRHGSTSKSLESEFKKGLKPVLWLCEDFPLRTQELLPLLDILANKVKAVRRLRELLTTKLPSGSFPVKVAIPVVPTIRVVVTFTKFEELKQESPNNEVSKGMEEYDAASSSWFSWMRGSNIQNSKFSHNDPFSIPDTYTWVDSKERKKREKEKEVEDKSRV